MHGQLFLTSELPAGLRHNGSCKALQACSFRLGPGAQLRTFATRSSTCSNSRRLQHRHRCRLCCAQYDSQAVDNSSTAVLEGATEQDGLLFGRGPAGAWDEAAIGSPVVRCYLGDNEQRWYMWYSGRSSEAPNMDAVSPSSGSVGVAISSDGINWTRGEGPIAGTRGEDKAQDVGMVLQPNGDWWTHDTCHLTVSDVQVMSNSAKDTGAVYWMFYSGGSFEPVPVPAGIPGLAPGTEVEGLRLRPGLAMSQDGRNWARIEGDHHSGALFDHGDDGEWDALFVGAPQVVVAGPEDMRMYYHSYDTQRQKYVVGLATSPDGFRWQRQGPIFAGCDDSAAFDGRGAAARHVVRDSVSRRYVMFYEAVAANDRRTIGLAVSRDGLKDWTRLDRPILEPTSGSGWDAGGVGAPCAVPMANGRWRLYYAGRSQSGVGPWEGIGLARTGEGSQEFEGLQVTFKRRPANASS